MKKKETIITYSLMAIMCLGIIMGSVLGNVGNIISNIVTSLTAVVSAIAVYIQMKKDTQITQAEFLLEFSKIFYSYEGAPKLEEKIDRSMENGVIYKYTKNDYELVLDYLLWLEALASMVENKTLSIKLINDLYQYRFFTVVNNPSIQERELGVFAQYYKSIYLLHAQWVAYRKNHNQEILQAEYDLSKLPAYKDVFNRNSESY